MTTLPSEAEIEAAAREICAVRGIDPDARHHRYIGDEVPFVWETYKDEASRILAAAYATRPQPVQAIAVPDGWKLVPVEPTEEMLDAVDEVFHACWKESCEQNDRINDNRRAAGMSRLPASHASITFVEPIYRAMLSASPSPDTAVSAGAPEELRAIESEIGRTYYDEGKNAEWFESLSDQDFTLECTKAAADLVDSDISSVECWMPISAIVDNAADRIKRLLSAGSALPTRADVLNALTVLTTANGADLDAWTSGNLPDDGVVQEALNAMLLSSAPAGGR